MSKKGVFLINLGTPNNFDTKSVRRYLKEFLNDPRVIDINFFLRYLLVNFIILPLRLTKTSLAYKKIWSSESPLLTYSNELKNALAYEMGENYQVEVAMRYGTPGIEKTLANFNNCEEIIIVPLFPQYSSAASGSAIENSLSLITKKWNIPNIKIKNYFYNHEKFITAYAELIKNNVQGTKIDLLLFSYHGLPERHINKTQCGANCTRSSACPEISNKNVFCYRAQCYATSNLLQKALKISSLQCHTSFQSRLGYAPWIKPYTDLTLPELIQKGIKNIAIACPSFITDCLETLEEIGMRAREEWRALGGNQFILIPCLNSHPSWVQALAKIVSEAN